MITIDHTKVGGTLTNFPLYLDLSLLNPTFFNAVQNGGADIRMTAIDGFTELATEVVSCDTTAFTGEVHILIPSVSSTENTIVYIYYGNVNATLPLATSMYGSQAVWPSNRKFVAHLESGVTDSTSNANDGTNAGSTSIAGKLAGNGVAFNGTNQEFTVPSTAMGHTGTISAWVNVQGDGTPDSGGTVSIWNSSTDNRTRLNRLNSAKLFAFVKGNPSITVSTAFQPIIGQWYKVTTTWVPTAGSNGTCQLFVNGILIGSNTYTDVTTGPNSLHVGSFNASNPQGGWFNGYVDEVRISNTVITLAEDLTAYNNQSSPQTFYIALSPEAQYSTRSEALVDSMKTLHRTDYLDAAWYRKIKQLDREMAMYWRDHK